VGFWQHSLCPCHLCWVRLSPSGAITNIANFDHHSISTPSQALLDVTAADNPALGYGASGILGLGFTSLSTIDATLNSTGSSTGRSLLFNLFAANPSQPNFISFAMQRTTEPNSDVEGSFAIGMLNRHIDAYANQFDHNNR
jgi:saccharopepsin